MNRLALLVVVTSSVAFAQELKPAQEEAKALFDKEVTPSLKAMNAARGKGLHVLRLLEAAHGWMI